jgi:hypothetical protein
MAKPSDFYIGVVDVFSILLPGAVVSWAGWKWVGEKPEFAALVPPGEVAPWVAFVLAAYALGHIMFMLASFVDISFNWFREKFLLPSLGQYRRAVEKNALDAASALRLIGLAIEPITAPEKEDEIQARARTWAQHILRKPDTEPTIPEPTNTYQWSRAVLRLRAPTALAEVERIEADSKFFRSLFVVFVVLAAFSIVQLPGSEKLPLPHAATIPLAALSYWRYAEQRQKGTVEAYRSVIVLFAMGSVTVSSQEKVRSEDD